MTLYTIAQGRKMVFTASLKGVCHYIGQKLLKPCVDLSPHSDASDITHERSGYNHSFYAHECSGGLIPVPNSLSDQRQ